MKFLAGVICGLVVSIVIPVVALATKTGAHAAGSLPTKATPSRS